MDSSTGRDDIDMDTFSDGDTSCRPPPAHIAARFYRKSSARRKSSAHSSRRSSLSSLHSHQSALSAHGGPQSDHVAQHLRRASIIESRKARLADRAAHAEKVRLRAAIAKAAPRATYREERTLAAQAAREKLLAEIAARCEEEVRRAKKVAEDTKEKKAAEHARLKEEMAEKFAEAARRRLIYQQNTRRSRTMSLPAVEDKKGNLEGVRLLNEETAAKLIQTIWKDRQRTRALRSFHSLGLSLARVKEMPFEDVGSLLAEERVLIATARLLKILNLIDMADHGKGERGAVRVFLSAYLILGHPIPSLSNGGKDPQEADIIAKAQDLLRTFEAMLKPQSKNFIGGNVAALPEYQTLPFLFNIFSSAFHTWKSRDASTFVNIMVSQFVELDLILQTVKDNQDGGVAEEYVQAIRQNQVQLLASLKKFAGADTALNLVRSAVRKARNQRAKKTHKSSEANVPRAPSLAASASNPPTEIVPEKLSTSTSLGAKTGTDSLVTRLGQTMTSLPSNREISHEMQINGTYEVQQQPWTDARRHFIDTLRSSMRQSMSGGGDDTAASWTHAMAILIREKLLNLISRKHPLYERVEGFLDPKIIDQTCRAGMFSYSSFFDTIAGLVAQICSPGRDDAVKAFIADNKNDTIDRLLALIDIIDLMTLDHINFAFRTAAPAVIEHGHEHEHTSFERDLSDGVHTLEFTRRWWDSARSSLNEDNARRSQSVALTRGTGNSIYVRGLVDLVLSNNHLDYAALPETLRLDWHRLLSLRALVFKIVATASILLTTKIRLRRNREAQWTRDAERIMGYNFADLKGSRILAVIESSHMMPESTKEGLLNFISRILPSAAAASNNLSSAEQTKLSMRQNAQTHATSSSLSSISHSSPLTPTSGGNAAHPPRTSSPPSSDENDVFTEQVAMFVLKSLREHIYARLTAVSTADKVRTTASAAETLARAGMPEFVAEVGRIVDTLDKVKTVDLRAHEKWYDQIAAAATGGGGAP